MPSLTRLDLVRAATEEGRRAYRAGERPRPPLAEDRCAAYWRGWDAARDAAAARPSRAAGRVQGRLL